MSIKPDLNGNLQMHSEITPIKLTIRKEAIHFAASTLRAAMGQLTDRERLDLLQHITEGYCPTCGTKLPPSAHCAYCYIPHSNP